MHDIPPVAVEVGILWLINLASSGNRVGDFGPFSTAVFLCCLLWACGQRACVVHHVHSNAVWFKPFVCNAPLRADAEWQGASRTRVRSRQPATELAACR